MRRLLTVSVPAVMLACILAAVCVEAWVRLTWDPKRGKPGFFVSDPVRLEKLGRNYDGWFAGVPVKTNSLGFRDDREYALEKGPRTVRILVLGDSVTFGHGSVYEHTYPFLLEQQLRHWRPDVDWQVWNLAVPGYNTSQELAYLLEVGPRYQPDLVIVGYFENDIIDNRPVEEVAAWRQRWSDMKTAARTRWYSFEWYRRVYMQLRSRAQGSYLPAADDPDSIESLVARPDRVADLDAQALTNPQPLTPEQLRAEACQDPINMQFVPAIYESKPGFGFWRDAVTRFHELAKKGTYQIMFFVNAAPRVCFTGDVFDVRMTAPRDEYLRRVLGDGTPAISSHDAYARYRPSQMPGAADHSIGNANAVKATVLFEFIRGRLADMHVVAARAAS